MTCGQSRPGSPVQRVLSFASFGEVGGVRQFVEAGQCGGSMTSGRPAWLRTLCVDRAPAAQLLSVLQAQLMQLPGFRPIVIDSAPQLCSMLNEDAARLHRWRARTRRVVGADGQLRLSWSQCLWWSLRMSGPGERVHHWRSARTARRLLRAVPGSRADVGAGSPSARAAASSVDGRVSSP